MDTSRRAHIGLAKRERTRAKLLEAAYQVFAAKELDAVTIDDIISAAGVARGTFYNYFETREDVLKAVVASLAEAMNQAVWSESTAIADPAERMAFAIRQFLHQAKRDATWGWLIVRIGLVAAPLTATIHQGVRSDLEAGIQQQRFQVDSVQAAIDLVMGTGLMAIRSILEGQTPSDYPEQIAKLILQTLGVAEPEAQAIVTQTLTPLKHDA
ncbi:TetR/AcrR family transcriptional regulator [filamentous cyanobacterium LEGE 11480]|uniref:TetR/AcrR family transcriptional regulator n=1 Tax=Romeriopsis navalis LEGE 11480 TaxID=2777977 RepID=A0A928Z0S3_9CYAN|nr:TetR/AcrR family transcriptional regulator [Romeriopsis navalis]MBE9028576.1 TetR/AcrR family transcriptional regulator [Romeriopsis navalis LEGE 11480]